MSAIAGFFSHMCSLSKIVYFFLFALIAAPAFAQSGSIAVSGAPAGTVLAYTETSRSQSCTYDGKPVTGTIYSLSGFSLNSGSTSQTVPGAIQTSLWASSPTKCSVVNNSFPLSVPSSYSSTQACTVTVSVNGSVSFQLSASMACTPQYQGLVYHKYVVVGVTYAPPGASSDVQYSGTTSLGTTSTYSSSFSNDAGFSISVEGKINTIPALTTLVGGSVQLTASSSTDFTQTQNMSNSVTLSKSVTNSFLTKGYPTTTYPSGPVPPALPNDYDIIWVWLNAVSEFTIIPAAGATPQSLLWNGYGYDPSDVNGPDVYPIQVGCLNGDFTTSYCSTQQGLLNRSWVTGQQSPTSGSSVTAPGCAPQTAESPSICPNTQDAYNILAADPFASYAGSVPYAPLQTSPLPQYTSDGRFAQFGYPPNPVVYEPNATQNFSLTQMNTQSSSSGGSTELKEKISLSAKITGGFLDLFKASTTYTATDTITKTNTWLTTLTTTQSVSDAFTITGSTPPNYVSGQYIVYQDNFFGTFMFYPN